MFNLNIKSALKSKPRNRVGLDIGSSCVKMLEIESTGSVPVLTRIGIKKLRDPSRETLVNTIRSLVEELKFTAKEVNIAVCGPSTIVRFVSMPKMKDDELKNAIRFEAEKYIPFSIEDCILDHRVLKKDDKDNKLDTLLVAVKKELVLDRIRAVEEGGLSVGLVDVDSFAAANAFLKNFEKSDSNKTSAVLNIGHSMTNLSILCEGTLRFSRDVAIGGSEFNSAISKSLNIDPAKAEEMKTAQGADRSQDVINCTKNVMNNLIDEVRPSFSYYENQSGKGIDDIYICGGSCVIAGLETAFQEAFESKPVLWDPLQFLDISKVSADAFVGPDSHRFFAVAAGLAIR